MEDVMKRVFAVMMLAGVLIFAAAIGAQAASSNAVAIKVPFAFQAGDMLMPAGEYLFEFPKTGIHASGSIVRISTQDGSICQYLLSRNTSGGNTNNDWHVSFAKYGDSYFLAKLRNGMTGADLPKTRAEKKLAAEYLRNLKPIASVELQPVFTKTK
jgi:hypothetical protein